MTKTDSQYIIGIDLGTTNSAVSYVDLSAAPVSGDRIGTLRIPQLVAEGAVSPLPVLPSFLYLPGPYDISPEAIVSPWKTRTADFVGAFARDHGASVPSRLVSSAKSWLCHPRADRRAKILPWGAGNDIPKVSPVTATSRYLSHIRDAWNHSCRDEEDRYLEHQIVILTVPASFDEVARDLTLEAAAQAGLKQVTLLEEPLAAFYNWLCRHEKDWTEHVSPGELILVCDVGGGTTDFTLITLREVDGNPRFERIAVGDHLILGGDNIDLALARQVEAGSIRKGLRSARSDRWKALCHHCRNAKERLLDGASESHRITLVGAGKKLIADTFTTELHLRDVIETVLEGFFPVVAASSKQSVVRGMGISEFGLPYETEPAITRHLGWFLERHQDDVRRYLDRDRSFPDLILFNGGSLKASVVQDRIREALRHWFGIGDAALPRVLQNPEPDLAVARGAAYYGRVKIGDGVRVGSGSARAYYLGVALAGDGQNGTPETKRAVCLVERGLEEGNRIRLAGRPLEVLTNQPVTLDLYSSSFRSGDRVGDLLPVDDTLTALPPVQTLIQFGKKGAKKAIPVHLEAEYTEMGTLALYCRSEVSDHRWRLQFQLRQTEGAEKVSETEVYDESIVQAVCRLVARAFGAESDDARLNGLMRDIADRLSAPKEQWPLSIIRKIADELLTRIDDRTRKPLSESRWLNLIGFCLRPGFGDGFDVHRVRTLWKIYKNGPVFAGNPQVRSEWWIMWRRVAGGLKPGQQRQFIQDLFSLLIPKKGGKPKGSPQELLEMWMAAANMERLMIKDKIKSGEQLLSELTPKRALPQHFWALSRFGARELLYGPVDRVIPPSEAESWIQTLISRSWTDDRPVASAVIQMGRKTGDRARDVSEDMRKTISAWLNARKLDKKFEKYIVEVVPMAAMEESIVFGESLPSGFVLRADSVSAAEIQPGE